MIRRLTLLAAAFAWLLTLGAVTPVLAQQTAIVVSACGTQSYTAGTANYQTVDITGNSCGTGGGGGGGGAVTIANGADVVEGSLTDAATCATGNTALACLRQMDLDIKGVGHVVVDSVAGDTYAHITTSTTTTVKASAGTIKTVSVNSLGTIASTVTIKDGSTTLAVINSLTLSGTWTYNIACATNITVVTTGTVAPDVTVTYN